MMRAWLAARLRALAGRVEPAAPEASACVVCGATGFYAPSKGKDVCMWCEPIPSGGLPAGFK